MKIRIHPQVRTYYMAAATNGSFQSVLLPAGTNAESVIIQVHDGGAASYDPSTNGVPFQFSHDSDGSEGMALISEYGIAVPGAIGGEIIGYVKAAAGNKIVMAFNDLS